MNLPDLTSHELFQISTLILLPLAVLKLEASSRVVKVLGSVVFCYAFGMLIGNLNIFKIDPELFQTASELTVPLAIPLLLFSTDISSLLKLAPRMLLSFLIMIFAAVFSSFSSIYFFSDGLIEVEKVASMMIGIYTGGTPNLTAIGLALGVDHEVFIALNASDILVGGSYLLLLLGFGTKVYGYFLSPFVHRGGLNEVHELDDWNGLKMTSKFRKSIIYSLISALILATAAGMSQLLFKKMNVAFIILFITTTGTLLSINSKVRRLPGTYEVGNYFILVFCFAVGSLADFKSLISEGSTYIFYTAYCMFTAILIHTFLCKLFKIDRDTTIITSVAGIYGPAFISPVATSLKNKSIISSGLAVGILGYAIANYLGIGLYYSLN